MIGEPTELKFGRLQKGAVKVSDTIWDVDQIKFWTNDFTVSHCSKVLYDTNFRYKHLALGYFFCNKLIVAKF